MREPGAPLPPAVRAWLGDPGRKPTPGAEHGPDPADTYDRVLPAARDLGVTRVADITGLDTIGIPVATAYRPNARSLAVSQGKGATMAAARASALMEAVEAAHAEEPRLDLRLAREAELRAEGAAVVSPADLPRRDGAVYHDHQAVLWTEGRNLLSGEAAWVPYDAVHLDLTLTVPTGSWTRPTSNGLASGNTRAEAVCHALCEVIERDAVTLWEAAGQAHRVTTRVDPAVVGDLVVQDLLDRFTSTGVDVVLYDVASDLGVPVALCHIADHELNPFRPLAPAGGAGCHLHPATAVVRALTEAAQTRLIDVAGARDDLYRREQQQRRDRQRATPGLDAPPLPPPSGGPVDGSGDDRTGADRFGGDGMATATVEDDIAVLLRALDRRGLSAVAVDLTRPEPGIPVVRVVVPGLEGPPAAMAGGTAPGRRVRAAAERGAVQASPDPAPGGRGVGTGRPVVFVGPTLPVGEVQERLDAEVRPPAAQGDVAREVASGPLPAALVLIDGSYEAVPAVWHKEILWALSRGVPVYGAASMGALRAAELAPFGMVGVGRVFDALMGGEIVADDDVAVAHAGAEDGFRPVSVALVDLRATLAAAVDAGVVCGSEAETVATVARGLFYPQRVWPAVLAAARRDGLSPSAAGRLSEWVAANGVSWKRADAEEVLDRVAQDLSSAPAASCPPSWRMELTEQWRRAEAQLGVGALLDGRAATGDAAPREAVTAADLLDELRLTDLYHGIHQTCLVAELASDRTDADPAATDGGAVELLRRGLGLVDDADLERWLTENEVDAIDLPRLAAHQTSLVAAYDRGHDGAVRRVVDHLRLRGRFADLVARARAKHQALQVAGLAEPELGLVGVDEAELWRWFFSRSRPADGLAEQDASGGATAGVPDDLAAYALRLGFEDEAAFRRAALRDWCYEVGLNTT